MFVWAAFSRLYLAGGLTTNVLPLLAELEDAAGGRIALHSVVLHLSFGLWCLFASEQVMEVRR